MQSHCVVWASVIVKMQHVVLSLNRPDQVDEFERYTNAINSQFKMIRTVYL